MVDTEALSQLAHVTSRDQFAAQFAHSFLVFEQALFEQEQVGFSTQVVDPVSIKRSVARPAPTVEVQAVVKAPGNPYPDRVSIGRARNCDVVVRDASVSKLHAHFRIGGPKLELIDIDSQNGTRVNGRPLAPHQPTVVENGDVILFGSVTARLVDGGGLYDILR